MSSATLLLSFAVSLLATLLGSLVVLWVERQRRPSLSFTVGAPGAIAPADPLGRPQCTWLHINVRNRKIPRAISWVYDGEPASSCSAWIGFFHLDGQMVFDRELLGRWTETPEPRWETVTAKGVAGATLRDARNTVDIPSGESSVLDVAIRVAGEDSCFGWNNESYIHNWRHPSWQMGKGRYLVRARVKTAGREFESIFLLANDVPYEHFRLEPAGPQYSKAVARK